VHAVLASELKRHGEATGFFGFATRMDLDNYNRNTGEGLHLTSIAAAWITIVYGFAGLRIDGALPALSPSIPAGWERYRFCVRLHGSTLEAEIGRETVRLRVLEGEPARLALYGRNTVVDSAGITLPLPTDRRG
jgi:maltose phosphorylase